MFSHLSLGVRDLSTARRFYDALLKPLGHDVYAMNEAELAYGPDGASGLFYLYPVTGDQVAGLGTHIAFSAGSREAVDRAYEASLAENATTVRKSGFHPDISEDYYGAIVLDPDGNKLEIVAEG